MTLAIGFQFLRVLIEGRAQGQRHLAAAVSRVTEEGVAGGGSHLPGQRPDHDAAEHAPELDVLHPVRDEVDGHQSQGGGALHLVALVLPEIQALGGDDNVQQWQ